jgi:pyridoxamine 5'-phosphate oxidase-like protein
VPKNADPRPSQTPKTGTRNGFRIDSDLKELIESGVAVLVSTGDVERRPEVAYGWGPRVREDGWTIDVFLDRARADQTLANVQANGHIAMTVADPVSYRSAQFKGSFGDAGEASAEDEAWVLRHREAFVVTTSLVGDPPEAIRGMWMDEVVRVSFKVERAFDQTPGPNAGRPL